MKVASVRGSNASPLDLSVPSRNWQAQTPGTPASHGVQIQSFNYFILIFKLYLYLCLVELWLVKMTVRESEIGTLYLCLVELWLVKITVKQ